MKTPQSQPDRALTPCLLALLHASAHLSTTATAPLAAHLCLSPETVHTYFKRIKRALNVDTRYEAVLLARTRGWLYASDPPLTPGRRG